MADLSALSNLAMEAMDHLQDEGVEEVMIIVAREDGGFTTFCTSSHDWVQRALLYEARDTVDNGYVPEEADDDA